MCVYISSFDYSLRYAAVTNVLERELCIRGGCSDIDLDFPETNYECGYGRGAGGTFFRHSCIPLSALPC